MMGSQKNSQIWIALVALAKFNKENNMNFIPKGSQNTRDVMGVYDADNNDIRSIPATLVAVDMPIEQPPANSTPKSKSSRSKSAKTRSMSTQVFCKVFFEGIHNWPTCDIEEVSYLKLPHRHIFHITCYMTVTHNDRDIEFIVIKHMVENWLKENYPGGHMGSTSCEQLAHQLINQFNLVRCVVSEDGENGVDVSVSQYV